MHLRGVSMLEHSIQTVVNVLLSMLVSYLFALYRQKKKENEALKAGVQALLRAKILQDYYKYTEKGMIPIDVLESVEACYKSYEALGENGVIDGIMEQLRDLPNH